MEHSTQSPSPVALVVGFSWRGDRFGRSVRSNLTHTAPQRDVLAKDTSGKLSGDIRAQAKT